MKILVADKLAPEGLAILEGIAGAKVVNKPGLPPAELLANAADADAIVVRSGAKITKDVIDAAKKLRIVGRAGVGVDNVDTEAATQRGIIVVNTPGGNAVTAAEHTIAMLLALSRYIPQADCALHAGVWEKSKFTGTEVTHKVLGVVGYGNIGRIVADRAQGLKMRVIVYDPFLTPEVAAKSGVEQVTLEELCRRADYITLHVPANESTQNLINAKMIGLMKKGVRLINCARGEIIDDSALMDGIQSGKIAGAALDVFREEPLPKEHAFLKQPKIICTPHLGASTEEAQVSVAIQVAEQIRDYLLSGEVRNAVNFPSVSSEMLKVLQPYLTLCRKMGGFLGQVAKAHEAKVKKLQISYHGTAVDLETKVLTATLVKDFLSPVLDASINYVNARGVAQSRGITVEESLVHQIQDFANLISLKVFYDDKTLLLAGAVFGKDNCRFVRFQNFSLEVLPQGYLLVVHNYDRPGVVGKVGTMLGDAKINISRMQVALDTSRAEAVAIMNLDQAATPEIQAQLRALDNVIAVDQIKLD